jgi:hypothetical protein
MLILEIHSLDVPKNVSALRVLMAVMLKIVLPFILSPLLGRIIHVIRKGPMLVMSALTKPVSLTNEILTTMTTMLWNLLQIHRCSVPAKI